MPLAGDAVRAAGLCAELVQVEAGGVIFAGRETGKEVDVGRLWTLNPAVKMHRAMRVLQTMIPRCSVPSLARTARSLLGPTKRSERGRLLFCQVGCGRSREVQTAGRVWLGQLQWQAAG